MAKVEVRIRYCCCCSLFVAAILIAIYTIIMYSVFLGLAAWSLSRWVNGYSDPAENCGPGYSVQTASGAVIVIDPYFCTLGWYTEELKYTSVRYPVLVINIVLFILIILSAFLIFVALFVRWPWLLLPWIGLMCLDIIRGTISCILIFVYAHHASEIIKPIATGIFFLGLQFFHLSLVLIMVAKFQYMLNEIRGVTYKIESPKGDKSNLVTDNSNIYPTMPSQVAYGNSPPQARREGFYQPNYNTYQTSDPRYQPRAPSELPPVRRDDYGRPYYGADSGSGYRTYGSHYSQQRQANYGKTM